MSHVHIYVIYHVLRHNMYSISSYLIQMHFSVNTNVIVDARLTSPIFFSQIQINLKSSDRQIQLLDRHVHSSLVKLIQINLNLSIGKFSSSIGVFHRQSNHYCILYQPLMIKKEYVYLAGQVEVIHLSNIMYKCYKIAGSLYVYNVYK